ncbi:hypothetical protein [Streptomyces sp. NPDC002533]
MTAPTLKALSHQRQGVEGGLVCEPDIRPRQQLDVSGRVEDGHHLLGDGNVERGPERAAHVWLGVQSGDPPERRHRVELGAEPLPPRSILCPLLGCDG